MYAVSGCSSSFCIRLLSVSLVCFLFVGETIAQSSSSSKTSSSSFSSVAVSSISATYTTTTALKNYFSTEGDSPYTTPGVLEFSALESEWVTPTANGWRNELKLKTTYRKSMHQTYEKLSARLKVELSPGGKTIVVQCHDGGSGALVKVFISDMAEAGSINNIPLDGVFDVYARIKGMDKVERKFVLGTVTSGQSFDVMYENNYGMVNIAALGKSVRTQVYNGSAVYLKFGSYLQAQDPVTEEKVEDPADFAEFYSTSGIVKDQFSFQNLVYTRN